MSRSTSTSACKVNGFLSSGVGGDSGTRLRLAGEGPMRAELERLCAARDIAGQVDFLGLLPSEKVRDELAAARADVLDTASLLERAHERIPQVLVVVDDED